MLIPGTYTAALLLTILSMLCWGSWANAFKLTGKWRFELFYYDYSLGVLLTAVAAAFSFGSFGEGFSFQDNLLTAGKHQIFYALAAGLIFNLANMLLVAAISIAGMAVAFPVGIGLALVVGVVWNYFLSPQGNPVLLALGVLLVAAAIVFDAKAYAVHARSKPKGGAFVAPAAAPAASMRSSKSRRSAAMPPVRAASGGAKGIALCLISGLLMGSFYPLVVMSMQGEIVGLRPYSVALVFAIGVFVSTFIYNLYFMNLPVEGEPIAGWLYFQGTLRQHMLGILGGVIWCVGTIANFAAASTPKAVQVGPAISYGIGQGATLVSALWGLLVWQEFAGAQPRVRKLLALMLILFVGGLALLSLAPLYAH